MGSEPKKVLVIQTAYLGDVVLTIPLFRAVKQRFPGSFLVSLVIPETAQILEGVGVLDEVITYAKKGNQRGLAGFMGLVRLIRSHRFDLCLLPHRSARSALVAFLSRIPRRIGFRSGLSQLLYTERVTWHRCRHEVERNLELMHSFGQLDKGSGQNPQLTVDPQTAQAIDLDFGASGILPHDPIIGIAPGSVWATKRWTPQRYAIVADILMREHQAKVFLLGSSEDEGVVQEIMGYCKGRPIKWVGRSLKELVALLSRCHLLVTNDNGAMHVAAALGIPIVAIFGSTTPDLGYGPHSTPARIIEHSLDCRPCGRHGYQSCPLGHFRCMKEIRPEEVLTAAQEMLKGLP